MEVDLEDRDMRVLELVDEYPRPTVSTLREAIHWASKNQHIHYRLNKLEDRGLVETWKDEKTDGAGPLAPKRADVTGAGEELLEELDDPERPESVEARLDEMERQIKPLQETYGKMKKRVADLEREVESHDEDLDGVAEDVRSLRRALEQLPPFGKDEFEFGDG
jgi:chromosome segregation ATPase